VARQEYISAVSELRQQMGLPQYAATAEPAGQLTSPSFALPPDEDTLVRTALGSRPEIRAAQAAASGSRAAVALARADRIPVPSIGPAYEKDESGVSFYGFVLSSPVPVLNAGGPAVRQREAEHRRDCVALEQLRQKTAAQVKATLVKWTEVQQLVARSAALIEPIREQTSRMERLYQAGQTDIVKLLQVRQRLIDSENARLDVLWQLTQAYADLLAATGCTPLVGSLPGQP
jgi:outer membrane protein, heavy metal efflux system